MTNNAMQKFNKGNRYGNLTLTGNFEYRDVGSQGQRHIFTEVVCDCGIIKYVRFNQMKRGSIVSCGCKKKERFHSIIYKHGFSNNPLYDIYLNIVSRCNNNKNKRYDDYGGRGISICEKWNDVGIFIDDMYQSYIEHCEIHGKQNTSIDRIDNDGDYSKDNCCWSTKKEQVCNRRNNVLVDLWGEKYVLAHACKKLGVHASALRWRVNKNNSSFQEEINKCI